MHKGGWDDLRFVLAVAEEGSVGAAARALGVNHATVLRRIAAFEEAQGVPVFDRTAQGYRVPADRLGVIEAAREVAMAISAVETRLAGVAAPDTRPIRVTSTDTFCVALLPRALAGLDLGGVTIELQSANLHADLSRMHTDIAVRPAMALPPELTGEQVAMAGFGPYASTDAPDAPWLSLTGPLARSVAGEWFARHVGSDDRLPGADSFLVLREMVAAGLGRTILPCILGDSDPRLRRLEMPGTERPSIPLWVASHAELADTPRLRRLRRKLAEGIGRFKSELSGD